MKKVHASSNTKKLYKSSTHPLLENKKQSCSQWGGKAVLGQRTITMTNTCSIDNLLYTMHLAIKNKPGIKNELQKLSRCDKWISTLLHVHNLFEKEEWAQGKAVWLNKIGRFKGSTWDAFGSEEDMITCRLEFLQSTEVLQACFNPACPTAQRRYNSIDIV